jgi:hypothetical protein
MKTSELLTHLGNRLEDPSEVNYTAVEKKQALDQASDAVANLIEWKYLTHLETVTSTITFAENETSKSFSDVFGNGNLRPLRDGIQNIYCEQYSNTVAVNKYIDVIPFLDNDSSYFQGTTAVPVAYLNDDKVFISPVNATDTAGNNTKFKVYYYKLPYKHIKETKTTFVFTASSNAITTSDTSIDFISAGFEIGQKLLISGSGTVANNTYVDVTAVTSTTLTVSAINSDQSTGTSITLDTLDNLGSNLDPILLDYAESILWYEDNKVDRASRARDSAITQVNILNAR